MDRQNYLLMLKQLFGQIFDENFSLDTLYLESVAPFDSCVGLLLILPCKRTTRDTYTALLMYLINIPTKTNMVLTCTYKY